MFGCKPYFEDPLGNEPWKGSGRPTPGAAASRGEALAMMATSVVAEEILQQTIQRSEQATQKSRAAGRPRRGPEVSRR